MMSPGTLHKGIKRFRKDRYAQDCSFLQEVLGFFITENMLSQSLKGGNKV